jgi:protein-S-isoprenylcysteine O-methyltransferase Ste14
MLSGDGYVPQAWVSALMPYLAPKEPPSGFASSPVPLTLAFGSCLAVFGIYIRSSAYRVLGHHFTFHVTLQKDHSLVREWPYSVVRHPSYTGLYLIAFGYALVTFSRDGWVRSILWPQIIRKDQVVALLLALFVGRVMLHWCLVMKMFVDRTKSEDKLLRDQFGKQWDIWAKDVPWRLIPGIY